jgi:phosphatidylglycerol lysyltransferase
VFSDKIPAAPAQVAAARRLVMEHGWNSTAYQILNPGISYWFAPGDAAVVGYVRRAGVLLAAGSPVCPQGRLAQAARAFEEFAGAAGCRVCYVCAHQRLKNALETDGSHAAIVMGAQPVWSPSGWRAAVRRKPSLRAQLHRARNKGVEIEELPWHQARNDSELRLCLREWLQGRVLPPLHFLVEPHVLEGVLQDRLIFAARHSGRTVAFLVASPVARRPGFLVEEIARSHRAPNGATELLIDAAMDRLGAGGAHYVTLGLVALANVTGGIAANPAWLRALMSFARAHANRFYNFRGLLHFRLKMRPDYWETIYAISNERRFSPRTLYAIGRAFAGMPPVLAVAIGAGKALRQELQWLSGKLFPHAAKESRIDIVQ